MQLQQLQSRAQKTLTTDVAATVKNLFITSDKAKRHTHSLYITGATLLFLLGRCEPGTRFKLLVRVAKRKNPDEEDDIREVTFVVPPNLEPNGLKELKFVESTGKVSPLPWYNIALLGHPDLQQHHLRSHTSPFPCRNTLSLNLWAP